MIIKVWSKKKDVELFGVFGVERGIGGTIRRF